MHPFIEYVNPYLGKLLNIIGMDKRFVKGEGCYLYDDKGTEYLDCIAAYGALPFGYNPEEIWECIINFRMSKEPSFIQPSALDAAGELAERLIALAPQGLKYVTYANSGAEAVEAAIKLCRSATGRLGILSADKGFHGKTLGALSATGNAAYQTAFGAPVDGFLTIPFGDVDALQQELERRPDYYAAFFLEPIQGEGGIIVPPSGYLKMVRQICSKYKVRMVLDEIQTGLGRTGSMFACQHDDIAPDVLLLAKALGGGIIPIGACLSNEDTYNEEFAMKHSSTFAGNSLACRIGLKTLDLLTAKDSRLISQAGENGRLLKNNLEILKERYPQIIKSVRGRGLMLGIEFQVGRNTFPGSLMGIMAEQDLLTPAISSYLLNVERLRVAPTLNGNDVIRVEPPLIITPEQCLQASNRFESMLDVLSKGNTARFLSFLVHTDKDRKYKDVVHKNSKQDEVPILGDPGRFAFLLHPLELKNYCEFDESLYDLDEKEIAEMTDKFSEITKPFVVSQVNITSNCGATAYGEFIAIPRTADQLSGMPRQQALDELKYAINLAKKRGAKIVGLGAYTSVVSMGGLYLKNENIPITTGNSYTVVSAVDAVYSALERLEIPIELTEVAVVGAAGSIGKGVAVMLSERVSKLYLVGNSENAKSGIDRLYYTAGTIYQHLSASIQNDIPAVIGSITHKISLLEYLPDYDAPLDQFIEFARKIDIQHAPVIISTSVDDVLPKADVVICATSSIDKLITPENLKYGAVVCDISRPKNIDREVEASRPDVLAIDGGIIEVPGCPSLGWNFGLEEGLAYACMAETMMLALEKHYEHTSLGSSGVTTDSILFARELANRHGFKLTSLRSFDRPLGEERWDVIKRARHLEHSLR